MSLVSVLMPYYKKSFIESSIQSILNQTSKLRNNRH